jgi:hypothetical protein
MTSSDVLDTTLNIQLVRAADILLAGVDRPAGRAEAPRDGTQDDGAHRPSATASMPNPPPWA